MFQAFAPCRTSYCRFFNMSLCKELLLCCEHYWIWLEWLYNKLRPNFSYQHSSKQAAAAGRFIYRNLRLRLGCLQHRLVVVQLATSTIIGFTYVRTCYFLFSFWYSQFRICTVSCMGTVVFLCFFNVWYGNGDQIGDLGDLGELVKSIPVHSNHSLQRADT
jgi:hypothetical protein